MASKVQLYQTRISDDKPRTYGFIERVANTLGVGRRTIYYAKKKASEVVEDPTRAIRSDALDMGKIRQAWDALTQPEPNKGMKIMVRCGDGEYAPHVVHWQTEKTRVLYDKATQLFGRLCGVAKWTEGKPEYVKKPGHKTCLCPYCFKMKLLMVAFVRQVRLQAKPNNKCVRVPMLYSLAHTGCPWHCGSIARARPTRHFTVRT